MWKAIWWKDWRETGWFVIAAAVLVVHSVGSHCGWSPLDAIDVLRLSQIKMYPAGYGQTFSLCGESPPGLGTLAIALVGAGLGLWQTISESSRQTWLFLLHRPVERSRLIIAKWAYGFTCVSLLGGLALGLGLWLSARPGSRPAAFDWISVIPWWQGLATLTLVYSGAFLVGIRTASWRGSRLLPLVLALGLAFLLSIDPVAAWWVCGVVTLLVASVHILFLWLAVNIAGDRDYP
jgi:ABC-type transport system involved in multi-copper enzyme maturation permease subunit